VYATAAEVEPLQPGSRVPSASVTSVKGETVDLAELVRERGALLVFYRGGW
jgi:peroxiredoxin